MRQEHAPGRQRHLADVRRHLLQRDGLGPHHLREAEGAPPLLHQAHYLKKDAVIPHHLLRPARPFIQTATMAREIMIAKKTLKSSGDVLKTTMSTMLKMIDVRTGLVLAPRTEGEARTTQLPPSGPPYLLKINGSALRYRSRLAIALHDAEVPHLLHYPPPLQRQGHRPKVPRIQTGETVIETNDLKMGGRSEKERDEVSSPINSEVSGSRDGPASKLPPSGPGGRAPRSYGPALRDGPPRPRSPEAMMGKEPPRGPRGSHRSPNVSLRPLSPRREPSPPRERSPPRRERSPPRRPRSPPPAQQPYSSHRTNGRDGFSADYDMSTRPYDSQMGRRAEAERIGATHPSRGQALEQPPAGPAPGRDRARGRNLNQSYTPAMRVWGQPQNKRSPESEGLGRYDDGPERNAPNDGGPYQGSRYEREREPKEHSQDGPRQGYAHQSYPPSRRSTVDGTPLVEEDARLPVPDERSRASSAYSGDHMDLDEERTWPDSAQYPRDDGQSTRSGRSLEDDYGQRPDPLPEARRLSIQERDGTSQYNRRDEFDAGPRPTREVNGRSGNWPVRDDPPSPQLLGARSSSPGSSSHRNMRPQPPSRMPADLSAGQKDAMVSSSRSEDFGAIQRTQPGWPSSHEQIGNEDHSNGDDKGRKDTTTGRVRIVRRDLSPTSANGPGSSLEPLSGQPTLIAVDSTKDSAGREGPSVEGQGLSRKGSLLARLSVPGASSSGDRPKGKRDQLAPSPTGGSSASLQARLENGERPSISRRETDDGDRRKRKRGRGGKPGPGGGRNRDAQG
ncbi:hypothetical protein FS837_006456 [Tulasnella sp. UAMH 9824]|nr:hypothetical protein FS837_006456 [Tulasnella sp. UAMH 9824]